MKRKNLPQTTINKVTTDDIINAAESQSTKGVIISGTNKAGAIVTLNGLETQASSAIAWNISLTKNQIKLFGQGDETLTVIASDAAGDHEQVTKTITIDTVAPKAATIDKVAIDDRINAAESKTGVTISGGNEAGATVTVNGLAAHAVSSTTWDIALTQKQLKAFGQGEERLKIVSTDTAGNTTENIKIITVDTLTPKAAINKVATDNIINASESKAGVTITGTKDAGTTVTLNGLTTQAGSDTTWKVTLTDKRINAFGQGEENLKIMAADTAGNVFESTKTITVDTIAPKAATVNTVAEDNIINASESKTGVTITGIKEAGSTVTLNGLATHAVSDTTWKLTLTEKRINAFDQGKENLKIIAVDEAGNTTRSSQAITIDTAAPSAVTVNTVATDNIMDSLESKAGVTISGSNQSGETVTVNGMATQALSATEWNLTLTESQILALGQGEKILEIAAADAAGNTSRSSQAITIDTDAPLAATVNTVATDNIINSLESQAGVTISGSNQSGETVTVNGMATQALSATEWNLTLAESQILALGQGEKILDIAAADAAGNTTLSSQAITIDTVAPAAATGNTVAADNTIDSLESKAGVTISGSNGSGETVTVNGMATQALSATEWSLILAENQVLALGQGEKNLEIAAADAAGNTTLSTQAITVNTLSHLKVSASAGDAINKVRLTVNNDSTDSADFTFSGLPQGVSVLNANGLDVTNGVPGFLGSADFTVVLPGNIDNKFNLSLLTATNNQATTDNTVKIALDSTIQNNELNFVSQNQNIWASGDNATWGFHKYIPLVGTETTPWTENVKLLDTSVNGKYDFGLDGLVSFQDALDTATAALNAVTDALAAAQSTLNSAQQEYDSADEVTQVLLWIPLEAAKAAMDIAQGIYDLAYPEAVNIVNAAQAAYDAEKDKLNVQYNATLNASADLKGKVGLQIDFTADAGAVNTALKYAMTTNTQYNQTSDLLLITPTLVNAATGDSVAFSTVSPKVKLSAEIVYDLGADISLAANADISALGASLINDGFNAAIPLEQKGSYKVIDFDSTNYQGGATDPFKIPVLENVSRDVLSAFLSLPTVTTEGKETAFDTKYFQDGGLVAVNFSEISDTIFNFINAKIELNPEVASLYNAASIDSVLTSLWSAITGDNLNKLPVFILDATDQSKSALFHVNTVADDLSTVTPETATLGFYMGYAKSNDFVKVNVDLDQLAALVANIIVSTAATSGAIVVPPTIINPLDQIFRMTDILKIVDVTGATSEALQKFVDLRLEVGAVDVDVSQNANFGQQFTLSVDDMAYGVTLEDNTQLHFGLNDDKGLSIPNASAHDANHDGHIDYSMQIVPKAMLSNDTELNLNLGYQFDFFKANLLVSLGAAAVGLVAPVFSGSLGPLLRVKGSMDQLAVDVYEGRFDINAGSDTVEITGIGYQDGTMFT